MKSNNELKKWFIKKIKIYIINGVKDFKKNDWYVGPIQSKIDFYKDFQYQFAHLIRMQKCGSNDVNDWYENFNCPINNRDTKEMIDLMSQFRDGKISYKNIFMD